MNYATTERGITNREVPEGQFKAIVNFNKNANEKYLSVHSMDEKRMVLTIWSMDNKPVVDIHKVNGNLYAYYFDLNEEVHESFVHHIIAKVFHKGKGDIKPMTSFPHGN